MQDLKRQTIKDIMVKEVIAVKISDSALYVLEVFNEHHVSSVPVLNEDGDAVLGFIGERVLLKTLGERLIACKSDLPEIADFMTKETLVIKEEDPITQVLPLFSEYGVKTALVVDENEHLTGIITRRELLRSIEDCAHHEHGVKQTRRMPVRITEKYRERANLSLAI